MNKEYIKNAGIIANSNVRQIEPNALMNVPLFDATLMQIQQAEQALASLRKDFNECLNLMASESLDPCPKCKQHDNVHVVYINHQTTLPTLHGLAVECRHCNIQSKTEYWCETSTETSINALFNAYQKWGSRKIEGSMA